MYSVKGIDMLALRLPPEIDERLRELAAKTGRSKSFYAREAILTHLEDLEDAYLALERLNAGREPISWEVLKRELAADDDA